MLQTDAAREPRHSARAPRVQLDSDHAAATARGEEPRGTAQAGTDVKDAGASADARTAREGVDGAEAAVVILVEGKQVVRGERPVDAAARAPHGVEHLAFADRMLVVEIDDSHGRLG